MNYNQKNYGTVLNVVKNVPCIGTKGGMMSARSWPQSIVIGLGIAAIPCIGLSQTGAQSFMQGCMETCSIEGNPSDCKVSCACQLDYFAYSFKSISPIGFNVFTPIEHPDLYLEISNDSATFCVAELFPELGIPHTEFVQACLESATGTDRDVRKGAWCGCIEDELSRFGATSTFLAELAGKVGQGKFNEIIDSIGGRYDGLAYRIESCADGRSLYNRNETAARSGKSQGEIIALDSCAKSLNYVHEKCYWRHSQRKQVPTVAIPSQTIRSCKVRAEGFQQGARCKNIPTDKIEEFVSARNYIRDPCTFWGADPVQFQSKLDESDCPIADAPVQLQFLNQHIAWPAVQLASQQIEGLKFVDIKVRGMRDGTYFDFQGVHQGKEYTITIKWVASSGRARVPHIDDMQVVGIDSHNILDEPGKEVVVQQAVPDDIPPEATDNMIERQLRRAAMNETDPNMKRKLWNQYRQSKGLPQKN